MLHHRLLRVCGGVLAIVLVVLPMRSASAGWRHHRCNGSAAGGFAPAAPSNGGFVPAQAPASSPAYYYYVPAGAQAAPQAFLSQIRDAVEELFNVKVAHVAIQNRSGKARRYRFKKGRTKAWKKAIVKLKPDHRIDFF